LTDTPLDAQDTAPLDAPEEEAAELSDDELVQRARECYRIGMDATASWREEALEDLQFLAGEQWDGNVKGTRDAQGRPALTVNRLPQFVRQVTNEQRQSKPAVTVNPVDDSGDVRTAEVFQGVIRNIEYTSNSDAAYAAGGQSAAITGLGYWDVRAEYEDERSFEQKLSICRIANALSVVMDPGAKEMAGDDARWVILSTDLSSGEWKSMFPDKEMPHTTGWDGPGDTASTWVAKDGVRVHEYRYITEEPDTLVEVPPGLFADMPDGGAAYQSELEPMALELVKGGNTRPTTRRKACWAKIAGSEVIERGELAGRYLQVVRVVGTELEIDGRVVYEGIIRHAKDTQRMLNYFVSAEAEAIALTPKAPWIATKEQIEGHEAEWQSANQRAASVLIYNQDPNGAPPPQRVQSEANVSAITNARMQAADDLKAVTGIYDGQLGARSNETSGRAILARQSQGQTANFHFLDNLGMAIRYTGRILIDLIPRIYSGPRVLRMLGEDGKHEMVPVNGAPGDFRGEPGPIQLNAGRYDVAVSMGPSYQSRRQELTAQLLELFKVNPAVSQYVMDLLIDSMDIPNGKVIAERLRKMLPPEIKPPDEKQPPPQVLAQQVAQSQQLIQQLTQALHAAQDKLDSNAQDNATKERIELTKLHVDLLKTAATLDSQENIAHVAMLTKEAQAISKRLEQTGFNEPTESTQQEPINGQ
jgi:hypothetical protein